LNVLNSDSDNDTTRVVLADECEILRIGMQRALELDRAVTIVGGARDARSAARIARDTSAHLVIFDFESQPGNIAKIVRELRSGGPDLRLLAFTWRAERMQVLRALQSGVHGYVLKSATSQELLHAVDALTNGHTYLSPQIATVVSELVASPAWRKAPQKIESSLSERETEVLQHIAHGRTSKEIATVLRVTVRTIESHRAQVMNKLQLRSVAALTKYAVREGFISVET
jgi:DNA-binding NarL/FixJ family response regulator